MDVPSLDGEQGKEDSTTTTEAVIDNGSEQEQQRRRQQGDEGKNEDNEKLKKNKDVPSLDGEQGKEDSMTTTEAVIDDRSKREQQQQRPQGDGNKNKDNEKNQGKEGRSVFGRRTTQRRHYNYY